MAKNISITLGESEFQLRASLEASRALVRKGIDPLRLTMEASGLGYAPLTFDMVVDILHIGINHAGVNIDRDAVERGVFDYGIVAASSIAANYIGEIVSGAPQNTTPGGDAPKKT